MYDFVKTPSSILTSISNHKKDCLWVLQCKWRVDLWYTFRRSIPFDTHKPLPLPIFRQFNGCQDYVVSCRPDLSNSFVVIYPAFLFLETRFFVRSKTCDNSLHIFFEPCGIILTSQCMSRSVRSLAPNNL